jgi:hypothetical protein
MEEGIACENENTLLQVTKKNVAKVIRDSESSLRFGFIDPMIQYKLLFVFRLSLVLELTVAWLTFLPREKKNCIERTKMRKSHAGQPPFSICSSVFPASVFSASSILILSCVRLLSFDRNPCREVYEVPRRQRGDRDSKNKKMVNLLPCSDPDR